jgi:hypothetical protein
MGYKPDWITFSISPWSWAVTNHDVSVDVAQRVGLAVAAVLAGLTLLALLRRAHPVGELDAADESREPPVDDLARTTAALLLAAFAGLAVVNPEYLALAVPALLVLATCRRDLVWATAVTVVPWLADSAFAVLRRSTAEGWPIFGDIHPGTAGFDLMDRLRVWLSIASCALLVVVTVRTVLHRRAMPEPQG